MPVTRTETPDFASTQVEAPESVLQTMGAPVLLLALFLFFSHLQDYLSSLHLPLLLLTTCLLAAVVSGGLYSALVESRIGRCLTILTLSFVGSVAFSVWKGGSFHIFTDQWLKSYAIYTILAALLTTTTKLVRAMWASVLGIFVTAFSALFLGKIESGRLGTVAWQETYADPNDLAQILIIGSCLACAILCRKKTGWMGRAAILVVLPVMCLAGAKTGSRGGLIGAMVVLAVLFFQSSAGGKFRMVLACSVVAVVAITMLPGRILNRYLSILGSSSAEQQLSSAETGSVEGRRYLLTQSLYVTAQHPLFGVGLGMFMNAEDTIARSAGMVHGSWHETHNMYTQVSSEAGLPAAIFFIGAFLYGFKNLNSVCRAAKRSRDPVIQDAGTLAFWMRLALVGLASTGFFLSVAYTPEPMMLLAMTVCLERVVRTRMATAPMATVPIMARVQAQAPVVLAPVALRRNVQFSSAAVANRAETHRAMSKDSAQVRTVSTIRKSRGPS
jgi:O-antigen ligase